MMKFKTVMYPTADDHDSDDIRWEAPDGSIQGYGFMSKGVDRTIHVVRCPKCHNENYMAQSVCVHCGFDPNPKEEHEQKTIR